MVTRGMRDGMLPEQLVSTVHRSPVECFVYQMSAFSTFLMVSWATRSLALACSDERGRGELAAKGFEWVKAIAYIDGK